MGLHAASMPAPKQPAMTATYPSVRFVRLLANQPLDFLGFPRERSAQIFRSVRSYQYGVFNPDTDILFRNVYARLDGDHHARLKRRIHIARIMNVEPDVMTEPVGKVPAQRLAMQGVAMRI